MPVDHRRQYSRRKYLPTGAFPSVSLDDWERTRNDSSGFGIGTRRCDLGGIGRVRQLVDTVQKLNCAAASMAAANHAAMAEAPTSTLRDGQTPSHNGLNDTLDETTVHSSVFFPVVFTEDDESGDQPVDQAATNSSPRITVTKDRRRHETEARGGLEKAAGMTPHMPSPISSIPIALSMRRGLSFASKTDAYAHLSCASSCTRNSDASSNEAEAFVVVDHEHCKDNDQSEPGEHREVHFDERCFTYSPFHELDVPRVQEGLVIEIPNNRVYRTTGITTEATACWTVTNHMLNDTTDLHERLVYHPNSTDFTTPMGDAEAGSPADSCTSTKQPHRNVVTDDDHKSYDGNDSSSSPDWIRRPGWDSPDDPPSTPRMMLPFQPLPCRDQMPPPVSPTTRPSKTCFFVPAMASSSSRKLSKKLYTELHKPVALRSRANSSTTVSGATCSQTTMTPSTPSPSKLESYQHQPYHCHGETTGNGSFISSSHTLGTHEQQQQQWLVSTFTLAPELPTLLSFP